VETTHNTLETTEPYPSNHPHHPSNYITMQQQPPTTSWHLHSNTLATTHNTLEIA